ncbi:MAG: hypothetical protein ACR2MQ_02675 [Gemmatimonadaceae bacterium]
MGERLLQALGADPDFVEAVLGDLAEEYALRAGRDGVGAARWWYGREALRSAPHVVRSWLRHARQHEPARLAAYLAGVVVTSFIVLLALQTRNGPPARFGAGDSNTIIVNDRSAVQLSVQVLDAAGHVLEVTGVRYQRMGGAAVPVSPSGAVTCAQRGDALVRASLGGLSRVLLVRCRPIRRFVHEYAGNLSLVVGDSAQELPFGAIGVDGTPETLLAGSATVEDSDVASLAGLMVRPKAPGHTWVNVWVGGRVAIIAISVYKRVSSSDALRPNQFFGVSPLRLSSGETRSWRIPPGRYIVSFRSDTVASAELTFATVASTCSHFGDAYTYFCTALNGAAVVVSAPQRMVQAREFSGYLAVRRE